MRKLFILLITLLLVFAVMAPVRVAHAQAGQPVVHAVLFWTNGCQYCSQTLTTTLPALQEKYRAQLSIQLIELASSKDVDNLYAFGASLGLSKGQIAVPFLLIDHTALIGVDEINSKLPGLIGSYLSKGGVEVPDMPILSEMLAKSVEFTTSNSNLHPLTTAATEAHQVGFTLAWVIMVLMWLAVICAIVMIVRAIQGHPLKEFRAWVDFAIPVLSLVGLGVATYLAVMEVTHARVLCGPVGDCNAVQSSPYARLFGFLPVAMVGAAGYIAILVVWLWKRFRMAASPKTAGAALCGMALFGTLFSIYLTYLELFVIHAVCVWCLTSAVIITALMLLNLPSITQWLAISDEEE
jgi:uncharacterized membrane protein